ncbi:MAG: hypothetical protein ABJC04_03825, partial [Verrucomicrobiota bacterium]
AATRKFAMPGLVEVFCTTIHLTPKQFYCEAYQHTWSSAEKVEHKADILGWPVKDQVKPPLA